MAKSKTSRRVFRAAAFLAIGLGGHAALSQEPLPAAGEPPAQDIEALEPAVDTSAPQIAPALLEADAQDSGSDAQVAADVSRSQSNGYVMDRMELDRTEVTGNQELPKVLSIVPWREADPGELLGRPVNSLLDEVLAPLDREEFARNVDYFDDVNGKRVDRQQ